MKGKTLVGTSVSAFSLMLGVGLMVALLPSRMLSLTGSVQDVGYLMAAFASSFVIVQVPLGNLSDRYGVKKFLILGYLTCSLSGLIYYYADSSLLILFGRVLQGLGEAPVWSLAPALLTSAYTRAKGKALGLYNASLHLGLTLGPIIGIITTGIWRNTEAFLFYSLVCLAGAFLIYFFVEEKPCREKSTVKVEFRQIKSLITTRLYLAVFIGIALYGAGYAASLTIIPVYLLETGTLTQTDVNLFCSAFYLMISISQFFIGPISDRKGTTKIMILGLLASAVALVLLPNLDQPFKLPVFAIMSLGFGAYHVSSMVQINRDTNDSLKGTISGAFYLFWGAGYFLGPILLSMISLTHGFPTGFYVFSLTLLGVTVFLVAGKRIRTN